MTPIERVDAVLQGKNPDHPPFSFWHHFRHDQVSGSAAVQAHLDQLRTYGMDFLKVMNDNPYPFDEPIQSPEDLALLSPLNGDEAGFGRQLELLSTLHKELHGQVYLVTTIFNAWMVLRLLVQPPREYLPPVLEGADAPSDWILAAYERRPEFVKQALNTIGTSLSRFAQKCLAAGADGIFLSVRDDWVDQPGKQRLYHQLVQPTDLQILRAASVAHFNILHVCGHAVDFHAFAQYPYVAAVNWADRPAGPSIGEVRTWLKPALCGGVDNLGTLVHGTAMDVMREISEAIIEAGDRPLIIAPGCTFDPNHVPRENLQAMANAVQACAYA